MVFNHKAYEELYPRKEKQPKQKGQSKKPEMGNVLEEAEQAPDDSEQDDPETDEPNEGGESDGNE